MIPASFISLATELDNNPSRTVNFRLLVELPAVGFGLSSFVDVAVGLASGFFVVSAVGLCDCFGNASRYIDRCKAHVYMEYKMGHNLNYTKTRRWAKLYTIYMHKPYI